MLQRLSDNIRECYLRADECRRHADETADPSRKQFYLDMERVGSFWPEAAHLRNSFPVS
jgi:hypothetical protein